MRPRMTRLCSNCKQSMFEPEEGARYEPEDMPDDQSAWPYPAFPHELHMENSSEVCPQWAASTPKRHTLRVEWTPEARAILQEARKKVSISTKR